MSPIPRVRERSRSKVVILSRPWGSKHLSVTISDPLHSTEDSRLVTLGRSDQDRTLAVVHSDFGETLRIISARLATRRERKEYEEATL